MRERTKTLLKLGLQEVLRTIEDLAVITMTHGSHGSVWRATFRDALKKHWRARHQETKRLSEYIVYCRKKGYILDTVAANGKLALELTEQGKQRLARYVVSQTGELLLRQQDRIPWDGRWRIVIFDIPEKQRAKRDAIRDALKGSGFYMLQRSVFLYPFPCAPLVHSVVESYSLKPYVWLLIAEVMENEVQLLDHFLELGLLTKKQIREAETFRQRRRENESQLL